MKKITFIATLFLSLFALNQSFSQKVAIIGMNHLSPDGFSFVATEPILAGEVIYFTENEYSDTANAFTFNGFPTGESVVTFTVTTALAVGDVVFVNEIASNTFSVTASSGDGTAVRVGTDSFALSTNGESLYAYSDTDSDPTNGVSEIYAVLYTGSGEAPIQNGGSIPTDMNPVFDFTNAIVVDGFPDDGDDFLGPIRLEYNFNPASIRDAVSKINLENPTNYVSYAASQPLSIVPFTNLNLLGANPTLTLAQSTSSVTEDSGTGIVYTFTLSANTTSDTIVNFSVSGNATYASDYTQTGATSFDGITGTATILNGSNTVEVTLTPVADSLLESNEDVTLTITVGTGYDPDTVGVSTTIINDDSTSVTPAVAITGINQTTNEGFSFVTLTDFIGGELVMFTENSFNNSTLSFSGSEAVLSWSAPPISRGEVIVVKEVSANTFTVTCNGGTCGTITLRSGTFDLASTGESLSAYLDMDYDPTNGIGIIYSTLFTGTTITSGGNIPSIEDPTLVYNGSILVDGFAATAPDRTEYNPSLRGVDVDQANFQNTTNWLHSLANQDLSIIPFNNIIITTGSANPVATASISPTSVVEDSGNAMVYTFTLDAPASGNVILNFTVGGTATFTTDYTVTGSTSFNATIGSVTILNGETSSSVSITPVIDSTVEILEDVELIIASGIGYNGGSPNNAIGTISNDDTSNSDPLVAITGLNHVTPDGFSFVAAKDIPAGTVIYFTDNSFNNNTLLFNTGEAVLSWTSPGTIIPKGDVVVITETSPDVFSLTCNGTSGAACGSVILESGNLAVSSDGETFYAYEDTDNDLTNGVTDIYAVLYTGSTGILGGTIPSTEDPSGIYLSALVVDGFPAIQPNRTEFDETKRGVLVNAVNFEDVSNWVFAQANQDLSAVPFTILDIVVSFNAPANLCVDAGVQTGLGGGTAQGGVYSGSGVTDDGNGMTYSFDPAAAGTGIHTLTYTLSGTSASDTIEVFALDDTSFSYSASAYCVDDSDPTPTITGLVGGSFSSGAGLFINASTGTIDVSASTSGTYTITYTTSGSCPNSSNVNVTVNALDDASFSYNAASYCVNNSDPTPTITGLAGGSFRSTAGLSIIASTGTIDVSASTPGTYTVTYTTSGSCPNSSSVSLNVNALPTVTFTAPADTCIDAGIHSGLGGGTSTGGVYSGTGVTDDGNGMTYSFNPAAAGVGTHTLTYTFTNANGCTDSAMDDVEVFALPVMTFTAAVDVCIDAGVQTGLGGGTSTGGVYFGSGVTDDGNGMTYSFNPAVAGVGTHTLTYTFTNANGCTGSAMDDVEVFALPVVTFTAPSDICIDAGVQTGLGGGTSAGGVYSGTGVTDDGNGMTYSFNPAAAGVGTHTLTYTFTNANGCTDSAMDDVEVFALPVMTFTAAVDVCIDAGVQTGLGGVAPAGGVYSGTGVTDDGNGMTYSFNPAAAGVGTHTLTYTFTNANGCTDSAMDDVEVFALPVMTFTAAVDVCIDAGVQTGLGGGTSTGGVYFGSGVTDDGNGMTYSFNPAVAGVGTHTLTYTFTNANGCTGSAMDDVEVFALPVVTFTAPSDICIDAGVQTGLGGGTSAGGVYSGTGVTDDGNGMTYSFNPAAAGVGTHTLTYTFTNANGCTDSAMDDVEVFALPVMTFAPAVDVCIDAGVQTGLGGAAPAGGVYSGTGVTDDGNGMTYSFDPSVAGVGGTLISYNFTDANGCNGYTNRMVQINALPMVTFTAPVSPFCPNSIETSLGGGLPVGGIYSGLGVTDDGNGLTYSFDSGVSGNGTHTLTYAFTNINGCSSSTSEEVTVEDVLPPVVITKNITIQLDENGVASITPEQLDNGSTDNCGIESFAIDIIEFDCSNVGENEVTLTVMDVNSNSSTATAVVTVEDTIAPTVITQNITVQLDENGVASITTSQIDNVSTDNCAIESFALDSTEFDCSKVGENEVTLTITDVNGNSNTAIAIVTVEDTIAPTVITQNITVQLDENGVATISTEQIDNASFDNCDIESYALDTTEFTCENIGENEVILTVIDVNDNSNTATAKVTVEDTIAPTVITQNITIQLDENGVATISTEQIDNASFDNCGIESYILENTAFDCSNVGENEVTLTVTDVNGNSNTATAIVMVEDSILPIALAVAPFTLQLDEFGSGILITAEDIDSGSTDICGIASITIDKDTFDCSNLGENIVTLTVTDVNGNSSTATTIASIQDVTAPIVITQHITVALDNYGAAFISANDIDDGSMDNCGIATMNLDRTSFECATLGEHTVTLTVTDTSGNTTSEIAIVTFTGDDLDGDLITDVCDPDMDGDGVDNEFDNCVRTFNSDQDDIDFNGIGDVCDTTNVSFPQGFSPNGDGIRDTYIVTGLAQHGDNTFEVYNRWGNKVFSSQFYQNNWDGTSNGQSVFSKNEQLPAGPYFYVLTTGYNTVYKGWIYINY